jgi:hypothetical protein
MSAMDVKLIRATLKEMYKPSDELLVSWWDKEWFENVLDTKITDDEWERILDFCEKVIGESSQADLLVMYAEQALSESRKEK